VSGPGSGTAERLAKEAIFNREVTLIIEWQFTLSMRQFALSMRQFTLSI
jgi:hypothetical protein